MRSTIESPAAAPARPEPDAPLLELVGVNIDLFSGRERIRVVDGLDLTIPRGGSLGLVGESGAGKSVTAMAIPRLIGSPTFEFSGAIMFEGVDLLSVSPAGMTEIRGRDIGMIFQEPRRSLHPSLTVGEQIARVVRRHWKWNKARANARALELLEMVALPRPDQVAKSYPHTLSGGMCQRVMIAMAIACEPKLLIADEPTTALDTTVQKGILDLLARLRRELNLTLMFITHDLGVVAQVCEDVAVMYAGQVVEKGRVEETFSAPKHPYTRALLDSLSLTPDSAGILPTIHGAVPRLGDWPDGCRFNPRCAHRVEGLCTTGSPQLHIASHSLTRCVRVGERGADFEW